MSRQPRAHEPGALSYVEMIANSRREIFGDEADRVAFSELVERYAPRCHVQIHAYCWSQRAIHMVVRVTDIPLGSFISRLASQHAKGVNGRLGYRGNLFAGRYRQTILEAPSGLLNAVHEIHLTAIEQGAMDVAARYDWSSHGAYAGSFKPSWLTTELVLRALEAEYGAGSAGYNAFINRRTGSATMAGGAGATDCANSPGKAEGISIRARPTRSSPVANSVDATVDAMGTASRLTVVPRRDH